MPAFVSLGRDLASLSNDILQCPPGPPPSQSHVSNLPHDHAARIGSPPTLTQLSQGPYPPATSMHAALRKRRRPASRLPRSDPPPKRRACSNALARPPRPSSVRDGVLTRAKTTAKRSCHDAFHPLPDNFRRVRASHISARQSSLPMAGSLASSGLPFDPGG